MGNKVITFLAVLNVYLYSYSGLIKWIPLGIDPTILFFGTSLLLLPLISFPNLTKTLSITIGMFLLLHLVLFATAFYTISDSYYLEKILKITLNIYIFILTISVFQRKSAFEFLLKLNKYCLIGGVLVLAFFYRLDGLAAIRYKEEGDISFVPEYMSISYYLAVSILLLIPEKNKLLKVLLISAAVFFMFVLAAKGPLLFLLLSFAFMKMTGKSIFTFAFLKRFFVGAMAFLFVGLILWNAPFVEDFKSRLFFLNGPELDGSSLQRILYIDRSIEIIKENPFFGIGIGGFGKAFSGFDERLSSHNLILEVFTESGLIGFVFLVLLVISIRQLVKKSMIHVKGKQLEELAKLFTAVIILMFTASLVASYLEDSRIPYFWIAVGVSFMSYTLTQKSQSDSWIEFT